MPPFTQKMLMDWAGPEVFRQGKGLFERGLVAEAEYQKPYAHGIIRYGQGALTCRFKILPNGAAENQCPCYDCQQRWITCSHLVATGLYLLQEEARKATEAARLQSRAAEVGKAYFRREPPGREGAEPARLFIRIPDEWAAVWRATGYVSAECLVEYRGRLTPADRIPIEVPLTFAPQDEAVLFVWEDIAGGPAPGRMELSVPDFLNLISLHSGRKLLIGQENRPAQVYPEKVETEALASLDWNSGEIVISLRYKWPAVGCGNNNHEDTISLADGSSGWAWHAGEFRPLSQVLPPPLQSIYRGPVRIGRSEVPRCLQIELDLLARYLPLQTDFDRAMFVIVPTAPRYRLAVRGSQASLSASLLAEYGDLTLPAGKTVPEGYFALPDPDNILRYSVRNTDDETRALARIAGMGLRGTHGEDLSPLAGMREVRNFLAGVLPALRRIGWRIDLTGSLADFMDEAEFAMPVVHIQDNPGTDWFEVSLVYEDGLGKHIAAAEVQRALLKGDAFLERDNRVILLDSEAINSVNAVFKDCASRDGVQPGSFRLPEIYTAYIKSALTALDGIDIEAPTSWLERADRQNRIGKIEPVALDPPLAEALRPYQHDGVAWLRFLEQGMFCGILADDMGLGKTVQALAWLNLPRLNPQIAGKPSLVICPTSLVENWEAEAKRFVPNLRVRIVSGSERHEHWDDILNYDLVITSYALLRRDVEHYLRHEFAVIILDEAQHIKNRSTRNAVAAKRLRSAHRLVLTGTPIENSIADLWSIMDFLMPGYLGVYQSFRRNYELVTAQPGQETDQARRQLRRKTHPFVLRRLKQSVARDLPPKIERVAVCVLTDDQRRIYTQYLTESRQRLDELVSERGFQRSRMEILKTLLRLRQICCHIELLKRPELNSGNSSAKLDLFMELLDEAVDGGHRVLVFSQFTSMLAIMRRELEEQAIKYSYLDGLTKNRMRIVNEFNARNDIPVFLISLKAGGTGLNITGADMVIHYDPWWNPAVEAQATDRAHRIGQTKTVYMVKLITRNTIEEKVLAMQKRKQKMIDATLQTSSADFVSKLTWDDIRELLA